jgi:hypothetical protein
VSVRPRPFAFQLLATLLTVYAMAGMLLSMVMVRDQDPRLHWLGVAVGGATFAVSAGIAAMSVWRQRPRSPVALLVCGAIGAAFCIAVPAAAPDEVVGRDLWVLSILGGVLFAAFLILAAWYVKRRLASG